MDVAQLRELGQWRYVGTHGHEHVPLAQLSRAAVAQDVATSLELLRGWLGYRPYALSYPYGSYAACSSPAGEGAAAAGIEFAFTTERAGNRHLVNPLHLARFDGNDVPGGRGAQLPISELFERVAERLWHLRPPPPARPDLRASATGVAS